jgi:hypothetical protein
LTSSSVPTLYAKSVISCAPTSQYMRNQALHSSTPQTPNSIPNIEITGLYSRTSSFFSHS